MAILIHSLSVSLSPSPSPPSLHPYYPPPLAEAAAREAALNTNTLHGEYAPPPSVIAPSQQSGAAEARMQIMQQQEEKEGERDFAYVVTMVHTYIYFGVLAKARNSGAPPRYRTRNGRGRIVH